MIELRAPTDADNYRVQAGRFGDRFYCDPLPADDTWEATGDNDIYPAISTVKKASGSDWAPVMAKRLAKEPSQLVEIGNLTDEFERKERIKLLDAADLGQASARGTAVHAYAEALLMNRIAMYEMSDLVKPYIRTTDAFFAAYNPKPVAMEFVAIHRTLNSHRVERGNEYHGYGGTGDAVLEIDGQLWLVDWKSRGEDSNHGAYHEEAAQAAGYGRADYWIVGDDTSPHGAKRIKPLELAGGLIVSIKPDSFECYPIDLDEGFDFWTDLHAWWQGKRSGHRAVGRKWAPRVAPRVEGQEPPPFDPSGFTIAQVQEHVNVWPESAAAILELETRGKNRKTLVEWLSPTPEEIEAEGTSQLAEQRADDPVVSNPIVTEELAAAEAHIDQAERTDALMSAAEVALGVEQVEMTPGQAEQAGFEAQAEQAAPTPESNRARFDALNEAEKAQVRESFQRFKLNPNHPSSVWDVARIIGEMEQRPTLREMQEASAARRTEPEPTMTADERMAAEGGPAPEEMVAEAKLMFDMVLTPSGKDWTGFRVKEANASGVSFRMSELPSLNRANLYLAICRWVAFRQDETSKGMVPDEEEGNVVFAGMLGTIDNRDAAEFDLGTRLGMLSLEDSQKFCDLVTDVVRSGTDDNPVTGEETQPASEPASDSTKEAN